MSGAATPLRYVAAAFVGALWLTAPGTSAADADTVVQIALPAERSGFADGPGAEVARTWCVMCHSADYVSIQPPLPAERWRAVVTKMRKVFGCPLPEKDVERLVAYLAAQNGPR